jgi:hypothetical protein
MGVQFEWQAGTGDGQWETLAETKRRSPFHRLRRVRWWVWCILGSTLLGLAFGGYILVRRRYEAATRQVVFAIQNVIDVEAQAFAQRDIALFLDQQDSSAAEWFQQQERRIRFDCIWPLATQATMYQTCAPLLPAQVEKVELRQDVAWVQVLENEGTVRRARFYRRTDRGWQQTAPEAAFWQVPVELRYDDLVFRYHRRDEPFVTPLIEQIYETIHDVCRTAECPPLDGSSDGLMVVFSVDVPYGRPPQMNDNVLLLASPWLSGLPVSGDWDETYLRELAYRVEHAVGARSVGVLLGDAANRERAYVGGDPRALESPIME